MDEAIELALESADGIIDCRLEPQRNDAGLYYAATILYPNTVNGYNRSEIYCHNMLRTAVGYGFEEGEIHPKVKRLEGQLSAAIVKARADNQ
ncbi:MAG: hypothetical protein K0Q79_2860 [Flavipsychrobacter sp.]|jgi:hypothetical protein|nr:hypothetical protein [Flavipsychrobacter sp.]